MKLVGALGLAGALSLVGCEERPSVATATPASTAPPISTAPPASAAARAFHVTTTGSRVSFVMSAPFEKIHGEARDAVAGELLIDLGDLAKSTGKVTVELEKLELLQQRRDDEQGEYGARIREDKQNEHARAWLEIGADVPEATRRQNSQVSFVIQRLEEVSAQPAALTGATRKLTATAVGELHLHGHRATRRAPVALSFTYEGNMPKSVHVASTSPVEVSLEEFDVRPRDAFGKLAQKTLGDLAGKVSKSAPVELELSAVAR